MIASLNYNKQHNNTLQHEKFGLNYFRDHAKIAKATLKRLLQKINCISILKIYSVSSDMRQNDLFCILARTNSEF